MGKKRGGEILIASGTLHFDDGSVLEADLVMELEETFSPTSKSSSVYGYNCSEADWERAFANMTPMAEA